MGIKESYPEIIGKSVLLETQEEKTFFNRSQLLLKNSYIKNAYCDNNLIKSYEIKSFINGTLRPNRQNIRDIPWYEYLIIHINKLNEKYHSPWGNALLNTLHNKRIIILENKYYSDFFYNEYEIKTIPKVINSQNEKLDKNDDLFALFNTQLSLIPDNNYCELDVLDNLGGSYIELNYDELLPDDPTFQYQQRRINVKKYIKIFKEHIYNNADHPINQIITIFNKLFSKYIQDKLKEYNNQLEKQLINQEKFDEYIKNFENEITDSLQEIISRMHSALKLFYSTTLDYDFFSEEKDDLINMITSFFFRTGNLYEAILNLYSYRFKDEFQNLQGKLIELKSLKPNKLGIEIKFCLDEDTLNLQKKIKNKNNSKIENKDNNSNKANSSMKSSLFSKMSGNINTNNLYSIKESEDEKDEISNSIKIIEGSKNKINEGQLIFYLKDDNENNESNENNENNEKINNNNDCYIPKRSATKLSRFGKEEYLLEKLSFEDDKNDKYYNPLNQIRNSVNNFNQKILLYPKLHEQLKKNIKLSENKDYFSKNKNNIEKNLPMPYISAINLFRSIKKYKTPFEKILLIAAISDQIMESADSFWKDMEPYIEKDFLFIESDEMMSIFLYIIIQAQMPEILIFCKIINNFTTQFTRGFNISYNYTLLEASLDYINELKDAKEIYLKQNGFIEARRSILDASNQRISRLSSGLGQVKDL